MACSLGDGIVIAGSLAVWTAEDARRECAFANNRTRVKLWIEAASRAEGCLATRDEVIRFANRECFHHFDQGFKRRVRKSRSGKSLYQPRLV